MANKKSPETTTPSLLEIPDLLDGFKTTSISKAIESAAYNENGIAMTPLASYEIGGQKIDSLLVSMRPGVGVAVHLHEEGGESQKSLTPVRGVFGIPKRNGDGDYELTDDGQVKFEVVENRIYTPDEITSIPAGLVHGYGNPSSDKDAHIIFDLPNTHTTAEDKRLADDETAALIEAIPAKDYENYAGQQPLVVAQLGHIAHQHSHTHLN